MSAKRTIGEVRFEGERVTVLLDDGSELCGVGAVQVLSTFRGFTTVEIKALVCKVEEPA